MWICTGAFVLVAARGLLVGGRVAAEPWLAPLKKRRASASLRRSRGSRSRMSRSGLAAAGGFGSAASLRAPVEREPRTSALAYQGASRTAAESLRRGRF